jgi:NADPH-dependent 2,4-dienoyl-CoA reductase/sulfur reductase-like enzyme
MGIPKSDPIIIVGGGAFGLSTALHLTRSGFTNISVYEKDDHIPPRYSAANDLNKIVRAEYEDPFYTDLTIVSYFLHSSLESITRGVYILTSFHTLESYLRMENPSICPSFPSNWIPPLCIW